MNSSVSRIVFYKCTLVTFRCTSCRSWQLSKRYYKDSMNCQHDFTVKSVRDFVWRYTKRSHWGQHLLERPKQRKNTKDAKFCETSDNKNSNRRTDVHTESNVFIIFHPWRSFHEQVVFKISFTSFGNVSFFCYFLRSCQLF